MQKMLSVILLLLLQCYAGFGQKKPVKVPANPYKKRIIVDVYKGDIPSDTKSDTNIYFTELALQHKPDADDGAFTLKEAPIKGTNHKIVETIGEWTVLKGSAADENATVVELDASGRTLYYLRRKDGKLQKLDATFHEIKPVKNYLLSKDKKKPVVKKKKKKK